MSEAQKRAGREAARHMQSMSQAALKAAAALRKGLEPPCPKPDVSLGISRQGQKKAAWNTWAGREILKLADENPGQTKKFVIAAPGERRYYEIRLVDVEKKK